LKYIEFKKMMKVFHDQENLDPKKGNITKVCPKQETSFEGGSFSSATPTVLVNVEEHKGRINGLSCPWNLP
jgi:hypothetical protein